MMRLVIMVWMVLVSFLSLQAETALTAQQSIERAHEMYKEEQYLDAAKHYEAALKEGVASQLYYNIANSYYEAGELGLAILNYERALRLSPNFKDAKYNLKIAQDRVVDKIDSSPEFWLRKFSQSIVDLNNSNGWVLFSFIFFITALFGFLVFTFAYMRKYKKLGFHLMVVSLFLFVGGFVLAGVSKKQHITYDQAIIINASVTIKNAPNKASTDLFQLHEGTKVKIRSTEADWVEISLENGAVGWMEESKLERI